MIYLLIILYSILMACLEVTMLNATTIYIFDIDYKIFHVFGLLLNIGVVLGLSYLKRPEKPILFILQAIIIYWIVFDMSFNLMSGKGLFYVGSGGLDMILGYWQYLIKAVLLLLMIYLKIKYNANNIR